jgi:hypothetical protein
VDALSEMIFLPETIFITPFQGYMIFNSQHRATPGAELLRPFRAI